jgi:1,2-diacylglycerol-3-alpha-glucose alpha-1,2-glucosyltransferase
MPLVLAPRGDDNKFSQDSFVYDMPAYGFSVLKKGQLGYDVAGQVPDFIVSHNPDDFDDSLFLRKFGNVPSVVHLHYQLDHYGDNDCLALSLANTRCAIVPSQFLADQMAQRFPSVRCHVISNGVRKRLFYPSTEFERLQFKLANGIPAYAKLIGFVGRLTQAKGLDILRVICRHVANVDLALVLQFPYWHNSADPGERERSLAIARQLKALAPDKVIIYPDKSPRLSPRPVRFFDALLMPSLSEVQPMVVLEALASGVQVIGTYATPFYDELLVWAPKRGICEFVDLPERCRTGASSVDCLDAQELQNIVSRLIPLLDGVSTSSDAERVSIARSLPEKYVDVQMYRAWTRLYGDYERSNAAAVH